MNTPEEIKTIVREKYGEIASNSKETNQKSCCGSGPCSSDFADFSEDYSNLEGYNPDADLGLGCGIPTKYAVIEKGDTVVDLGSGAGNDCFVVRSIVGESGKVIGVDMTPEMIEKARDNAEKLGFNNVEFRQGEIESLPVGKGKADVVISNCVLNLVPDKQKAFSEIYRILKPGGHFCVSDIVLKGTLPPVLKKAAEMYAGCVSGALEKEQYISFASAAGFEKLSVKKEREIIIPNDILAEYLNEEELKAFRESGAKIMSITLVGEKEASECCSGGGCC